MVSGFCPPPLPWTWPDIHLLGLLPCPLFLSTGCYPPLNHPAQFSVFLSLKKITLQTSYVTIALPLSLHHQIFWRLFCTPSLYILAATSLIFVLTIHWQRLIVKSKHLSSGRNLLDGSEAFNGQFLPPLIPGPPSSPWPPACFMLPYYYWELFGSPICFPSNMAPGFDFGFYGK